MSTEERDSIYSEARAQVKNFRFDESVVRVFPDMIRRSVPGYPLILEQLPILARRVVQPDSQVYDLGCSLGAVTLALRRAIQSADVKIVAVDNSAAMVARCRDVLAQDNSRVPVEVKQADILHLPIERASLAVLNFTLQFIPPAARAGLIRKIADGLLPEGAIIIAEKLNFDHADEQELMVEWHHDFKRAQGYSDMEIAQKRAALEKVMIPDTQYIHEQRLREAGLQRISCWFRCLNFAAFIAFKP